MADSTIDSELFVLQEQWPGESRQLGVGQAPAGGFTGSAHHNVATAVFGVGEKVSIFNHGGDDGAGLSGRSDFIYLQVGTQNADAEIAVKSIVAPDSATLWYQVSNDPDTVVVADGSMLAAVAISPMTNSYWGWFWCGGVCPENFVSGLGGNYLTEGTVVAGQICTNDLTADAIGFGPVAGDTEIAIGMAYASDAA